MAPSPFRRRKAAKSVRNLAIAEAALALARDRAPGGAPSRGSRRSRGKLLLLGGAVAAAGAVALLKRDKVAGLLPSRSGGDEPYSPPAPPQPSNYDVPGPVANTATPVPAPDPHEEPPAAIDEAHEEAAAAAEAAAIGGSPGGDYAGPELGEAADEAHRPLAEAGEGESEGEEQAEAELAANAEYRDGGVSDAERQIDETIEEAGNPTTGETPEPLASEDPDAEAEDADGQPSAQGTFLPPEPPSAGASGAADDTVADTPGGGISGRPFAGLETPPADADADAPDAKASASGSESDDSDDWKTWSGRSVKP